MTELPGRPTTAVARTLVFSLAVVSAVFGAHLMGQIAGAAPRDWLGYALLGLFVVSFLWLAFGFWTGMLGFFVSLFGLKPQGLRPATALFSTRRTAILMPVRNESPARTIAAMEAMDEALAHLGASDHFHFFILSDTNDPTIWVEEEVAWARLVARRAAGNRIFYRRRPLNTGRKSGNVAEFLTRWGGGYDYMIVLDADSLMEGRTIAKLSALMDANPDAGLIQVPTVPEGRRTLLGRMIQFAAHAYGPMFTRGLAFWLGDEGTYWGHNAIMRTSAFAAYCGLPKLRGRAPFGGEILSHDVVEAALLRRAGYKVFISPELDGSYEEAPANIIEYAKRDRRWCQGNLQHIALLSARGLHPINRIQLFLGVAAYVIAPFWLLYILLSVGHSVVERFRTIEYFTQSYSLAPQWPVDQSGSAMILLIAVAAMLFLPRLLSLFLIAISSKERRRHGGLIRLIGSTLIETFLSTLFAPLLMVFQTRAVIETLTGQDSGWPVASREVGSVRWRDAVQTHLYHLVLGLLLMVGTIYAAPNLVWWLAPVAIPLILSTPLAVLSGSVKVGGGLSRIGLLSTPDEIAPTALLQRARTLTEAAGTESAIRGTALDTVTREPAAYAVHSLLLRRTPATEAIDTTLLAATRAKLGLDGAMPAEKPVLTPREELNVLLDPHTLEELAARVQEPTPA